MPVASLDSSATGLDSTGLHLMILLESFARTGDSCYPSDGALAKLMGCSRRTVNRTLETLEASGWVGRTRVRKGKAWARIVTIRRRIAEPINKELQANIAPFVSDKLSQEEGLSSGTRTQETPAPSGRRRSPAQVRAEVRMIPDCPDADEDDEPPRRRPSSVHAGTLPPKAARPPRSVTR